VTVFVKADRSLPIYGRRTRARIRRIPVEAWICAAVACLNAVAWSLVTPLFQVPDEPDHIAYVQQLAENGKPPLAGNAPYSPEEEVVLDDLHFAQITLIAGKGTTIARRAEQLAMEHDLGRVEHDSPTREESAGVAAGEPPLYYALEAVPFYAGSWGSLLDRLILMRLASALIAGFTGLFAYLFLLEALPAVSWSWLIGGLGVALFPLLGFMSGAVNPDALLFAVSAALFYSLARAFRHGFSTAAAAALGGLIAAGLLTKLNFIGLLPGTAIGALILILRVARTSRRAAVVRAALLAAVAAGPVATDILFNLASGRPWFGVLSSAASQTSHHGSALGELSYIWQMYLPALPWMTHDFAGISMIRQVWFNGLVGDYGWLETFFPEWVYDLALIPAGLILILAARAVLIARGALRGRLPELAVYSLMVVGLTGLIGADGYLGYPEDVGSYTQARYLLPLLVLGGAVLTLAARGGGRRWGPVVGAAIVVLVFAHDIFSQLLVISRYYV
jgi:4-amino-4-deoxy-L-arabinose transferase-like glycosyltransferase